MNRSTSRMDEEQLAELPPHLAERTRLFQSGSATGKAVVYWMRTAVRADENPALDVAICLAHKQNLPLLVYHAISQHYRYASDRHHTFMLEGARDVQAQLKQRGISYAFHLATRNDSRPHLVTIANQAAIVITEDMPVDPPRRFLKALAQKTSTPLICVDTACVAPMQLITKAHTRAFKFRSATQKLYDQRLTRDWPTVDLAAKPFPIQALPFQPIDLSTAAIPELLAACEIDHAVGPVTDTHGGSTAGYARWNQFKEHQLAGYAKRRNNALVNGVSRMSAYLHYGMVSPMRIAREAAQIDNSGSKKYLDELLVWRELAYNFCFHRGDHDAWSAIPDWAKETLQSHASDRRSQVYNWEQLARAQTHDRLWNAAQLSLLRNGELHNNVRMTWGKAILNWTTCPQQALQFLFDLNHRYALDGRDPASYGGLLWCLGQFDRPFSPEQSIIGSVRPRTTHDHAKRLDADAFYEKVARPRFPLTPTGGIPKIAIVGAGISGLFAARTLSDHGATVEVFDKGRNVGGRMATRLVNDQPTFDHGAQYFTARDPRFQRYVDSWCQQGIVARWPDPNQNAAQQIVVFKNGQRFEKRSGNVRYVGVPAMNEICKHLADGLTVHQSVKVTNIETVAGTIRISDDQNSTLGDFDRVIVTASAEQTADLLTAFPDLAIPISKIKMQPCWAVMATLERPLENNWVGAFVHDSIVSWAARNGTKPGRPSGEYLLLHANHQWTSENWDRDPQAICHDMLAAFWESSGLAPVATTHTQVHRWKFAIPADPPQDRCFFDKLNGIAACGDWAGGPRVEGAFLSGMAAAGRILSSYNLFGHDETDPTN